jgi:hypothetical protein
MHSVFLVKSGVTSNYIGSGSIPDAAYDLGRSHIITTFLSLKVDRSNYKKWRGEVLTFPFPTAS